MIRKIWEYAQRPKLYCPHDGKRLEYPHDDYHKGSYDIFTGKQKVWKYKIRTKELAYCIKHDIYFVRGKNKKWEGHRELINILHLIA